MLHIRPTALRLIFLIRLLPDTIVNGRAAGGDRLANTTSTQRNTTYSANFPMDRNRLLYLRRYVARELRVCF